MRFRSGLAPHRAIGMCLAFAGIRRSGQNLGSGLCSSG